VGEFHFEVSRDVIDVVLTPKRTLKFLYFILSLYFTLWCSYFHARAVQDVSINGLPLEMVKNAAAAAIKRGVVSSEPVAPLGRWKVDPSKAESAHYE